MIPALLLPGFISAVSAGLAYNPLNFPLVEAGVIPDTLPDFTPKAFPALKFTTSAALLGNSISQAASKYAPKVTFVGDGSSLYTLAIVDNDAPERSNNIISQVEHFLAFNIPSLTIDKNLTTLGDRPAGSYGYISPAPPAGCGTHRYVIALFRQGQGKIDADAAGLGTPFYPLFFDIKSYAAKNNLQLVGANYWTTSADPAPYCTFFTNSTETQIAPAFAVGYGLGTDPRPYSRKPN